MCYKHRVFKNVSSFVYISKEKIGTNIFCCFIIAHAILVFVYTYYIGWLHAGSTHVFHMNIFHIAINTQLDSYFYFIPNMNLVSIINWDKPGPLSEFFSRNNFLESLSGVSE